MKNIIQRDGKYYIQASTVLAPSDTPLLKGDILLRHLWKGTTIECRSLWQFDEDVVIGDVRQFTTLHGSFRDIYTSFTPQHLYIFIDETIPYVKDGGTNGIFICLDEIQDNINHNVSPGNKRYIDPTVRNVGSCNGCREILACTHPTLCIDETCEVFANYNHNYNNLATARIPQEFIKEYTKAKGIRYDIVLVEIHQDETLVLTANNCINIILP